MHFSSNIYKPFLRKIPNLQYFGSDKSWSHELILSKDLTILHVTLFRIMVFLSFFFFCLM